MSYKWKVGIQYKAYRTLLPSCSCQFSLYFQGGEDLMNGAGVHQHASLGHEGRENSR